LNNNQELSSEASLLLNLGTSGTSRM